jgi:hypothetical protein
VCDREPTEARPWTQRFRQGPGTPTVAPPAPEANRLDYPAEVDHAAERIPRLEQAIGDAATTAPALMCHLIDGVQAMRDIARVAAATIVAKAGRRRPRGSV